MEDNNKPDLLDSLSPRMRGTNRNINCPICGKLVDTFPSYEGNERNPARKPRADEVVRELVRPAEHMVKRTVLLYVPFIKQDRD